MTDDPATATAARRAAPDFLIAYLLVLLSLSHGLPGWAIGNVWVLRAIAALWLGSAVVTAIRARLLRD